MKLTLDDLVGLHTLDKSCLVVDVGGYNGEYAEKIRKKFDCSVLIFEPSYPFYENLLNTFKNDVNVTIENKAISHLKNPELYLNQDGTTLYKSWYLKNKRNEESIIGVDAVKASERFKGLIIDVLKLNCEGSEYDIIADLYECDMLEDIQEILVQFHKVSELIGHYKECQDFLSQTHERTYNQKWQLWKKQK